MANMTPHWIWANQDSMRQLYERSLTLTSLNASGPTQKTSDFRRLVTALCGIALRHFEHGRIPSSPSQYQDCARIVLAKPASFPSAAFSWFSPDDCQRRGIGGGNSEKA